MPRKRHSKTAKRCRSNTAKRRRPSTSLHMVRRAKRKHKPTGIEEKVAGWLEKAGIDYQAEYPISRVHVDFYVPETNTVIEVCGCYWHAHECLKGEKWTAKQLQRRKRDSRRYAFLLNAGYKLLLIWECEIERHPVLSRRKVLAAAQGAEKGTDDVRLAS